MTENAVPELLTAAEAARRLRCHERTIRRMIGRGDVAARLVAGRWLIHPDDLDRLGFSSVAPVAPPKPRRRVQDDVARRYSRIADEIIAARQAAAR